MKLAAAICWYDEDPAWLERCVRSLAPIVDTIIHADGPWQDFPHDGPVSPIEQRRAIIVAAHAHDLGVIDVKPRVWASQVEKRQALYAAGWRAADYLLVIDADEELRCANPDAIRATIEAAGGDAFNVRVQTPIGRGKSIAPGAATAPVGSRWQPRIMKAHGSMRVGPVSHQTITTPDRVIWMHNHADIAEHAGKARGVIRTLRGDSAYIVNHTHSRDAERMAAKADYGKARAERGID